MQYQKREKLFGHLRFNYSQGERLMMIYMLPCCYVWQLMHQDQVERTVVEVVNLYKAI